MFELNKFFKYFTLFFIGIIISITSYSATITAVSNNNWNAGSTWAKTLTGTITTSNVSTAVVGIGTSFTAELQVGNRLYTPAGAFIGTVGAITDNTNLVLSANALSTNTNIGLFSSWESACGGTITTSNVSTAVTGVGTSFTTQLKIGSEIYTTTGVYLGKVSTITDNTNLVLTANAASTNAGINYKVGGIPSTSDDVIIPVGITVTTLSALSNYKSIIVNGTLAVTGDLSFDGDGVADIIDVYGTLNVSGNITYNQWEADKITIKNGGTTNVAGNVTVSQSVGASFVNENGGTLKVTGSINYTSNIPITLTNDGYIEVGVDLLGDGSSFTNNLTGTIWVHGTISGGGSKLKLFNYGIITIDNNVIFNKTEFTNYAMGKFIVFGDITFQDGSKYTNSGLVQCNAFHYESNAGSFDNSAGTLITLSDFDVNWSGCPCGKGEFFYTQIHLDNPAANTCGPICSTYWTTGTNIIAPGRRLWLNSSFIGYGLGSDGQQIDKWFDLANSFGFKMAQPTLGNQPTLKNNATDNVNFNPVLSFDGANINMDLDGNTLFAPAIDGGMAMFAVVIPKSGGSADQMVMDYGLYPTDGYGIMYSDQNMRAFTSSAFGGKENNVLAHTRGVKPTMFSQTTTWSGNQIMYINGVPTQTQAVTLTKLDGTEIAESNPYVAGVSGPFTLGGSSANPTTYDFDGKIAEVIVYANNVSAAARLSTESFLAIKYGITLNHSYTDYAGNTVYALDGTYDNSIIGIAREDLNLLRQRQSKSLDAGNELTISTAAIVAYDQRTVTTPVTLNNSYFICGHNGNTIVSGNRVYKAVATDFNQQVTLEFDIVGLAAPYYELLVANNSAFTGATTIPYTSVVGNKITFQNTFANNATSYFKLSAILPVTQNPGVGINTESIHNSAELHIVSTDKGILLPALANSGAIVAAPTEGLLFYNTDNKRFMYYDGTVWKFVGNPLKQDNATLTGSTGTYTGEIRYNTTTKTLWVWNGTTWVQLKNN